MVYLLNDFVCVLLGLYYSYNICHILCICIYLYEYSYAFADRSEMKNISHIEYMNIHFLQCVSYCEYLSRNSLQTDYDTPHTNTSLACHHVDAQ